MQEKDQQALLRLVNQLKLMTQERGCFPGEAEAAALKLGQLIQKHNLIVLLEAPSSPKPEPPPKPQTKPWNSYQSPYYFYGPFVLVIGITEKAILLRNEETGDEFWMPRSQLREDCQNWERHDSGQLICTLWWAQKQGWTDDDTPF